MCGGSSSLFGLFMIALGLAGAYGITTYGPKLSLQNRIKSLKLRVKTSMLLHNRIIS
jgi:hypothetical protein